MKFIDQKLLDYCQDFSSDENNLLKELNRQTNLKINQPRMLSGHIQGRFLSFLSKLKKPNYILEIGTYTGYSAICLSEGLSDKGKLITIDPNEETNCFAKQVFKSSPYDSKIELIEGLSQEIIPSLNYMFDLVFIDADKQNYNLYFDLIIDKVNPGGIIIADNVLWSGKVLDKDQDIQTQYIHQFNIKVNSDKRVDNLLLPIRDGLMLMQKL